ncbi:MAG: 50S ribosomal protein L3 [Deltaproteobacteria bacterium]|nr:50S ribosomal protein L3 [Deltaproteobacteria bacterium]
MLTELIGRKIGMTQIFEKDAGRMTPVTVVQVGPCRIVQVKRLEKEGYNAVQLGFEEERKKRHAKKSLVGHSKKHGVPQFRHLQEVRVEDVSELTPGMELTAEAFAVGDQVHVTGVSKGKGFAGVIKRHGFGGGPKTHGSRFHRAPGSIGQCVFPGKIIKGRGMPGHMGCDRVTVKNLKVMEVIPDQNLLLIKGAVPGANNGILRIRKKTAS